MRILFVSGAMWGATNNNQRYQALAEAMQRIDPTVEVKFYSFVDGAIPPEYRWTGLPMDVIIVGYPQMGRQVLQRLEGIIAYRIIVYDICDYWRGNELIEGVDLVSDDDFIAKHSSVIVAVNWQLACQYLPYKKPIYVIGNGLREEALTPPHIQVDNKVHIYYWGAHFTGQTWTDINALAELPKRFPNCQFHYYFATDMTEEILFPQKPPNLAVKTSPTGVEFIRIKSEIVYPAIGLVPFKPLNTAAFFADPIKVYEYWSLGFHVITTNIWSSLGERPIIIYRQGNPLDEISSALEEILQKGVLSPQFPSDEERQLFRWETRARQYLSILRRLIPSH